MAELMIVTLTAEAGRQWQEKKEAIGTHGRSIVFLPRGVQPGEKVRVELEEVRADARGRMMYRGRPAPVVTQERWVERDGKIERVELSVDWKCQEIETRILESRSIVRRDGEACKSKTVTVELGTSLGAARVLVSTKTAIPELEDHVDSLYGDEPTPREREMALRDAGTTSETFAVEWIEPVRSGCYMESNDWLASRRRLSYAGEPNLYVRLRLTYGGGQTVEGQSTKWADLPLWVQSHLEAHNPICGCGRERVDVSSGKTVCSICLREQEFEQSFPMERRRELAAQAAKLAAVEPVSKEAGEIILRSSFDHVRDSYRRDNLAQKCAGFAWYYFTDEGVYGAKFPRAAFMVLANLACASRAGLRELAFWLAGPHKLDLYQPEKYEQSYYVWTQVKGKVWGGLTPASDELVVAVRLCGSMADRQAAIDEFERAEKALGERDPRVVEIERMLQGESQDFGQALLKIREIEAMLAAQERGEVLVNFGGHFRRMGATDNADHWVVLPDGTLRAPDQKDGRYRYEDSEGSKYWNLVDGSELAISWSKAYTAAPHEFAVAKLPIDGVTSAQVRAVAAIEEEILASYSGMTSKESPALGRGWGLGSTTVAGRIARRAHAGPRPEEVSGSKSLEPQPAQPVGDPVDLAQVDLSKLFGGNARRR